MQIDLTRSNSNSEFFPLVNVNQITERKKVYVSTLTSMFVTVELLVVTTLFYLLYYYRIMDEFDFQHSVGIFNLPRFEEYSLLYFSIVGIYIFWGFKYESLSFHTQKSYSDQLYKIIKSYSYAILIAVGIAFVLKITAYSRFVVICFWVGGILLSGLTHYIKRLVFNYYTRKGIIVQKVLIIGAGKVGTTVANELVSNVSFGYQIIGFVDDRNHNSFNDIPVLGSMKDILTIIKTYAIDEIIVTIPSDRELVNQLIKELRKYDIQIKIIPDMYNLVTSAVEIGQINALPYVTLIKTPMRGISLMAKRLADIVAACIITVLLVPLLLMTAICIKLESKGPVFYKQKRVGKNGQIFSMYKFRSMVEQADGMKELLEYKNEADGPVFKIKNDPRITRVGKFIRKYSIDELPQLFNVLKGDMSLVGPRPPLPKEVEQYGDWEWRRLEVVPGITGLWQVSGRSDLSFHQWMNLDVYYIENWSLALDLKILLKTIPTVLKGEGAY